MSTFHGLEMAKQALFAQQSALSTTSHNISNANTDGYTRQRVNFETTTPYPPASRNRPEIAGQMGTGVESGSVERIRNKFLDYQYRSENSTSNYWDTKADALSRMEDLMNEPSDNGMNKTMDQFWESLQDLAGSPENAGARSVVAQRGKAVAETFNYLSDSLGSMRSDLKSEIDVKVKDANAIVDKINSINKQVKNIETNGQLANDLYDERDRLIDELSGIVNIDVSYTKSSDSAPDMADGLAGIKLADENGSVMNEAVLVNNGAGDGAELDFNEIDVSYSKDGYNAVSKISVSGEAFTAPEFGADGSINGLIESYGYMDADSVGELDSMDGYKDVSGTYTNMSNDLDDMAAAFADEFNQVHSNGADLNGDKGIPFFKDATGTGAAEEISVNEAIMDDSDLIAAAGTENGSSKGPGDGSNASALADVFDKTGVGLGKETSVRSFYESMIGDMGVNAEKANTMVENTDVLRSQVNEQRMSVSSVSLDEEMSNMIKFQHAYSAAARSMTAVDEMLERVINNMGLVGR